ncbi:hypothetical protein GCM10022281_13950 [Sphingomonas rosea]|uniref:Uncharacterized protein n=1 Tax=Sphingomonas rosea TaxID=335605 RepID=A0ABP7U2N1_9SPHN
MPDRWDRMTRPAILVLAAVVASSASVSATAEIPVSPLKDIYLSYNDCLEVAQPAGLSTAKLGELGWQQATMSDGKSKAVEQPLIFGKADRKPLIILSAKSGEGICIVMARIQSRATFPEFLKAWGGKLPAPDAEGRIIFSDEGRLVVLQQTGSDQQPALTMSVMTPTEKK